MPSQSEIKWSQLKVGILVVASIAALIVLIFLMSNSTGGLFTRKIDLRAYFDNANGLKEGAPVTLDGVTIGNVVRVRIVPHHEPNSVEVTCRVGSQFLPSLHTDSVVNINQAGVLGDSFVDIRSTSATGPEPVNNSVLPASTAPGIQDVVRTSQDTIAEATKIIHKLSYTVDAINSGKGTAGLMMNDPALAKRIVNSINELNAITEQVSSGKGTLGKLIYDDSLYAQMSESVTHINSIASGLDSGTGTVGMLLRDDSLYHNLNDAVANTNQLLAGVNAGHGALGKLAHDPEFADKMQQSLTQLNEVLRSINSGKGTLGQLVNDRAMYDTLNTTLQETSQLVSGLRQDPKKYLTVHVKLF